ncbi:MAG: NAD(P)-binding domain-containing protein [Pseudomonadota bacterium]
MKISILGAGNVGTALASGWRRSGHDITFGVRDPNKRELAALCEQIGARALSIGAAVADADVVVLAVPWDAVDAVLAATGSLQGRTVIDCTNPIVIDEGLLKLAIGHTNSGGEIVAAKLPQAHVVKTLNQIGAELMADNESLENRPLMFVAGDNDDAKQTTLQLVRELGFEPQDAGSMQASRLLEPFGMLWINQSIYQGLGRGWAFGAVRRARGRS